MSTHKRNTAKWRVSGVRLISGAGRRWHRLLDLLLQGYEYRADKSCILLEKI
jgi:hypothetical protein